MPLFFSLEENNFQLAIWKMDEDVEALMGLASLTGSDIEIVNSFTHMARKKEWICIRLLLIKLSKNYSIGYHESGKPYLKDSSAHISISHTKEFAGLIISDSFSVGIDLERISPRIEKIAHKFVSEKEEKIISGKNTLEKLFVIWGVKEVLFKMHSIGELIFKEHLSVMPFEFNNSGVLESQISKDDFQKRYSLRYKLVDDLLITWCVDV